MKGMEDNTDDRKRQGQHKRQAHIWKDKHNTDNTTSHTGMHLKMPNLIRNSVSVSSPGLAYIVV